MKQLPKKIKVGPYNYDIKKVPNLRSEKGEELHGYCRYAEVDILIDAGSPRQKEKVIVMHESLHALFELAGIKSEHEEGIVTALAPLLVEFYNENPKLMEYFKHA